MFWHKGGAAPGLPGCHRRRAGPRCGVLGVQPANMSSFLRGESPDDVVNLAAAVAAQRGGEVRHI